MIWSAPPQVTPPAYSSVKSTPSIPDDRRYGFDQAELGMSLGDWRRLSTRQATAACVGQGAGGQAITYSTQNVSLGGSYWARNPTYKFLNGKLEGIAFQTSIDGFDFATATLKRSFGEPKRIVRDTVKLQDGAVFPHVLMTWTNGRSTITLSDPAPNGTTLSVQFVLNKSGPQSFKAG